MNRRRERVQEPGHSTVERSPGVTSRQRLYRAFGRRKRRHRDETTTADSSSDNVTETSYYPTYTTRTYPTSDDETQTSHSPTSTTTTDATSDDETQTSHSPTSTTTTDTTSDDETQTSHSPASTTDVSSGDKTQNSHTPASTTDVSSGDKTQNSHSPASTTTTDTTSDDETQTSHSPTSTTMNNPSSGDKTQNSHTPASTTTTDRTSDKETEGNYDGTSTRTSRQQDTTSCGSSKIAGCLWIQLLLVLFLTVSSHYVRLDSDVRQLQQEVKSLQQWMNMFHPLGDTMANFALESQGATVLSHLSSDTYWPKEYGGTVWDRISDWLYSSKTQRRVIQGHSSLHPGECWSFEGDHGDLFISLSHPASITHVTLGHITKSQSLSGHISSAPRTFSVYGMKTTDEEGTYLGTMVYDKDGTAFQTFRLLGPESAVFRHVKLQIQNNWGQRDNTCIYSFRVHGNLPSNI